MKNLILTLISFIFYAGCSGETPYTGGGGHSSGGDFSIVNLYKADGNILLDANYNEYLISSNTNSITKLSDDKYSSVKQKLEGTSSSENKKLRNYLDNNGFCKKDGIEKNSAVYSLYTLDNKKAENRFATECYPLLVQRDRYDKISANHRDKVFLDDVDEFDYRCYKQVGLNINNRVQALYIPSKDDIKECKNKPIKSYIAYWDDKRDGMALKELNDYFKDYTDMDLYPFIKVGMSAGKATMIEQDGIHTIEQVDDIVTYRYIDFKTKKETIIKKSLDELGVKR